MNPTLLYQQVRRLAHEKRGLHKVETAALDIPFIQRIYKAEGITIDRRPLKGNRLRAAYFCDDGDCSVLLKASLPREPKIFSLIHELKHHYLDREIIQNGEIKCGDYNANELIEKSAEVFAAEFIYPEAEMRALIADLSIGPTGFTPETIVHFKKNCPAPVSYTFLVKRFVRFGFCERGEYAKVKFQKLEEELYGTPIYKEPWFKRYRERQRSR
jgi:Zn-dependent peptidase ImmA (M78 family)